MNLLIYGVKIRRSWYLAMFFVLSFSVISFITLDLPIFEYFYQFRGETFHHIFNLLTDLGKSTWYIIFSLLVYIIWRINKPQFARAGLFVLSTTILSGILINIVKIIFGRARPRLYIDENLYGFFWFKLDVLYRSFPSGHATTAMGVWLAFALLFPKYRFIFILVGGIIALSRVIIGEHYLSDVLIGGWVGAMTTLILYEMFYPKEVTVGK